MAIRAYVSGLENELRAAYVEDANAQLAVWDRNVGAKLFSPAMIAAARWSIE